MKLMKLFFLMLDNIILFKKLNAARKNNKSV